MTDEIKTAAQRVEKWLHYQGAGSPHAMSLRHDDLRTLISAASARGVADGYVSVPRAELETLSFGLRMEQRVSLKYWGEKLLGLLSATPSSPAATPEVEREERCEDCPPVGYPTDETRCLPCPRRTPPAPAGELTTIFENAFPDGTRDRSTYSDIEDALDLADAPSMDGTRWLHLPERIAALTTTAFIAGRDAAAGVDRAAIVAWLRSEAAMNTFRAETCAEDMVVEFDLYRQSLTSAATAIERCDHLAIEAPREAGRAATTLDPRGAALTPDAQVIGADGNVGPHAADVEQGCSRSGGNAGEGGDHA